MTTNLDDLRREWEKVRALAEKVSDGPWFTAPDAAEDTKVHANSGLALVETGRAYDSTVARLCEWHAAEFIAASRQWPTLISSLFALVEEQAGRIAELEKDAGRYRWLRENSVSAESWYDEEGIDAFRLEFAETHSESTAGAGLDAAIDSALAARAQEEKGR